MKYHDIIMTERWYQYAKDYLADKVRINNRLEMIELYKRTGVLLYKSYPTPFYRTPMDEFREYCEIRLEYERIIRS